MSKIVNLIKFTELTLKFQKIIRAIYIKNENRKENDLEHSGQLALICFYLIDSNNLKLDSGLAIKYALIHDIVEAYAGDTHAFRTDLKKKKIELEKKAAIRLKTDFKEFKSLHKLIQAYELKIDPESKFVYALDKILPTINIYLNNGKNWKKEKITLQMIVEHKTTQVRSDPTIDKYFHELIEILKKKKSYFPKVKNPKFLKF